MIADDNTGNASYHESNSKPYLVNLPIEILIKIFVHLPTKDLINISQTCVRLAEVSSDKSLLR